MAKTPIKLKLLYERRNTSDVFSRLIVMGMLRLLNQKLTYEQVWEDSDEGILKVTVPFFFDFSGGGSTSERFILDNYMHWTADECTSMGIKKIDGDFKPIPYGVLKLESSTIESGNISNRFVLGKYQKKVGKELKAYVAMLYSIPLTFSFSVNIGCDNINTMWKIELAYREFFYKNKTFRVNYKGTVVPCRVGFPESLSQTTTSNYTFGALNTDGSPIIKLSFNLSCETYLPVFDPYTELPAENMINGVAFGITISDKETKYVEKNKGIIIPVNPFEKDTILAIGKEILLLWTFSYENADLMYADILYLEEGNDELKLIETIENHNCYHLELTEEFFDNYINSIDLIIPNNDDCNIVTSPNIKLYPNKDNIISAKNAIVIDKGFIMTSRLQINANLCYETKKGKIEDKSIKININNNMVDEDNPVEFKDFVYNGNMQFKKIKLFIRDHYNNEIITPFLDENTWITIY